MSTLTVSRRNFVLGLAATPLALTLFKAPRAFAQATDEEVTITAANFKYDMPDSIPSGFRKITLHNQGEDDHHAQLTLLNDGVSVDDAQSALLESEEKFFPLVTSVGGPGTVAPGLSQSVILNLAEGSYLCVCFVVGEDGVPHYAKGMIKAFDVVASDDQGTAPTADTDVTLEDYAYVGIPDNVSTGSLIWKLTNNGPKEQHELQVLKLAEGFPLEEAIAMMTSIVEGTPPAMPQGSPAAAAQGSPAAAAGMMPVTSVGGMQALAPEHSGYLLLDLDPADYMAACFIPSPLNRGEPHIALGMVQGFTVS